MPHPRASILCCKSGLLAPMLLCALAAPAQVLELTGGSSTLYQAEGGTLTWRTPTLSSSVSAGGIAGRFVAGASLTRKTPEALYSAGMQSIRLDLPTDLWNADHVLHVAGIGYQTVHPPDPNPAIQPGSLQLFAGAASTWLDTPLFQGVRAVSPAAAFIVHKHLATNLDLASQLVYASTFSAIQAIRWRPDPAMTFAASFGRGGGSSYAAFATQIKEPLFDLRAGYIYAGPGFQRAGLQSDLSAEPIHTNIDILIRSSRNPRFTVSASHGGALVTNASASSVDDLAASAHLAHLGLTANFLHSSFNGLETVATAFAATYPLLPRVHVETSYLESHLLSPPSGSDAPIPTSRSLVANLTETLSSRLAVTQNISYSAGRTTLGLGGSIQSNWLTFSAGYQTFYIPSNPANPFQQSLIVNLECHLFHRIVVEAGSFVSPTGKLLYSTQLRTLVARSLPGPTIARSASLGAYVLRGRVVSLHREPIAGAALQIGSAGLFTDSQGRFFFREERARSHNLGVLTGEFLDGLTYRVVAQPGIAISHRETGSPGDSEFDLLIIVERIPPATPTADLPVAITHSASHSP